MWLSNLVTLKCTLRHKIKFMEIFYHSGILPYMMTMMTSWHRNAFGITDPMYGVTGGRFSLKSVSYGVSFYLLAWTSWWANNRVVINLGRLNARVTLLFSTISCSLGKSLLLCTCKRNFLINELLNFKPPSTALSRMTWNKPRVISLVDYLNILPSVWFATYPAGGSGERSVCLYQFLWWQASHWKITIRFSERLTLVDARIKWLPYLQKTFSNACFELEFRCDLCSKAALTAGHHGPGNGLVPDSPPSPEPNHDDVIKWKHFPRYWPFVRGIHRLPVDSPKKGQSRGALIFSLICAPTNGWKNNRDAGDLRRYNAHYDVMVMDSPGPPYMVSLSQTESTSTRQSDITIEYYIHTIGKPVMWFANSFRWYIYIHTNIWNK